jgi:hypothetical protein
MAETTTVQRGDVVRLLGPAADQLVLVLDGPRGGGKSEKPDVLAAPVRNDVDRRAASTLDVLCPPDASGLGVTLVVAAWATATVPLCCLGARVAVIEDARVFEAIRDVRLGLVDNTVKPSPDLVGLVDLKGETELAWHAEVRAAMAPYWDGSAVAQCEHDTADSQFYALWMTSASPGIVPIGLEPCATFHSDITVSDLLIGGVTPPSRFFAELGGLGYRVDMIVDLSLSGRASGQWGVVIPEEEQYSLKSMFTTFLRRRSLRDAPTTVRIERKQFNLRVEPDEVIAGARVRDRLMQYIG